MYSNIKLLQNCNITNTIRNKILASFNIINHNSNAVMMDQKLIQVPLTPESMESKLLELIKSNKLEDFDTLIDTCDFTFDPTAIRKHLGQHYPYESDDKSDSNAAENFSHSLNRWIEKQIPNAVNDSKSFKRLLDAYTDYDLDMDDLGERAVNVRSTDVIQHLSNYHEKPFEPFYHWLSTAIKNQDYKMIEYIIDNVIGVDSDALMEAFNQTNVDIISLVLNNYIDSTDPSVDNLRPLFESKKSCDVIIKILNAVKERHCPIVANQIENFHLIETFIATAGATNRFDVLDELSQEYPETIIDASITYNIDLKIYDKIDAKWYSTISLKAVTVGYNDNLLYSQQLCLKYLEYANNYQLLSNIFIGASELDMILVLKEIKADSNMVQSALNRIPQSVECIKYLTSLGGVIDNNTLTNAIKRQYSSVVKYLLQQPVIQDRKSLDDEFKLAIQCGTSFMIEDIFNTGKAKLDNNLMMEVSRDLCKIICLERLGGNSSIVFCNRVEASDGYISAEIVRCCNISKELVEWGIKRAREIGSSYTESKLTDALKSMK